MSRTPPGRSAGSGAGRRGRGRDLDGPTARALPALVSAGIARCLLYGNPDAIVQAVVNATYPAWPWAERGVISAWRWLQVLSFLASGCQEYEVH